MPIASAELNKLRAFVQSLTAAGAEIRFEVFFDDALDGFEREHSAAHKRTGLR